MQRNLIIVAGQWHATHLHFAEDALDKKDLVLFWFHSSVCDSISSTLSRLRRDNSGKTAPTSTIEK